MPPLHYVIVESSLIVGKHIFATHGTKCIAGYLCVGCCLEEVIINEAIEDGVGAGGGDAQHVAEKEGDHHRLCIIK